MLKATSRQGQSLLLPQAQPAEELGPEKSSDSVFSPVDNPWVKNQLDLRAPPLAFFLSHWLN